MSSLDIMEDSHKIKEHSPRIVVNQSVSKSTRNTNKSDIDFEYLKLDGKKSSRDSNDMKTSPKIFVHRESKTNIPHRGSIIGPSMLEVTADDNLNIPYMPFSTRNGFKNFDELRDLLKKYPDLLKAQRNNTRSSLLHIAVKDNDIETINHLLDMNMNVNMQDYKLKTPLHWAVEKKSEEIIQLFIKKKKEGIDFRLLDIREMSIFHYAIISGESQILKELINLCSKDVLKEVLNLKDYLGFGCLHAAIYYEKPLNANLLLTDYLEYIDLSLTDKKGRNALHLSSNQGYLDIVKLLIELKCDVNVLDNSKNSALHFATKKRQFKVVEVLLNAGIDTNAKNEKNQTALHLSVLRDYEEISHLLTHKGGDLSVRYDENLYVVKKIKERVSMTHSSQTIQINDLISDTSSDDESLLSSSRKRLSSISLSYVTREDSPKTDGFGYVKSPESEINNNNNAANKAKKEKKHRFRSNTINGKKLLSNKQKRQSKWLKMIRKWDTFLNAKNEIVRNRVFKGIPEGIRVTAWRIFTKIEEVKVDNKGEYDKYIEGEVDKVVISQIDIDINRSQRNHILYLERFGPGQISLFRILKAFSVYDKDIGYCQGMSDITAFLLLYVEEEECFHLLAQLCHNEKYDMKGFFLPGFPGLKRAYHIHNKIMENYIPEIYNYLTELDINPDFYAVKWFLKVFLDTFNDELIRRIWDIFLFEGYYIVYTVIYVLLKRNYKKIITMSYDETLMYFNNMGKNVADTDEFLQSIEKHRISKEEIKKYSDEYEK